MNNKSTFTTIGTCEKLLGAGNSLNKALDCLNEAGGRESVTKCIHPKFSTADCLGWESAEVLAGLEKTVI